MWICPNGIFIRLLLMANEFWVDLMKVNLLVNMMLSQGQFLIVQSEEHTFISAYEASDDFFCSPNRHSCLSSHHTWRCVTIYFDLNPLIAVELCFFLIWMANWSMLQNNGRTIVVATRKWCLYNMCLSMCVWQSYGKNQCSIQTVLRLYCIYHSWKWQASDSMCMHKVA